MPDQGLPNALPPIHIPDHYQFQHGLAEKVPMHYRITGHIAVQRGANTLAFAHPTRNFDCPVVACLSKAVERGKCGDVIRIGGADDAANHYFFNASTPGRGLPSIHSRKAPPAVET